MTERVGRTRRFTSAVGLVIVVAACGSGADDSAPAASGASASTAASPLTTTAESGHDPGTIERAGLGMSLPTAWSAYALEADGSVTPMAGAGPLGVDALPMVTASAMQGATLHAVGPADADGRTVTMTVAELGAEDTSAGADVSDAVRARLLADGVTDLTMRRDEVAGREATVATFRHVDAAGATQDVVSVYVPGSPSGYLLSFSTPLGTTLGVDDIEPIVASCRLA